MAPPKIAGHYADWSLASTSGKYTRYVCTVCGQGQTTTGYEPGRTWHPAVP